MTKDPRDIIVRPLVTEKGSRIQEAGSNQFFFEVRKDANKVEIKQAVEKIWKVHVEEVRTIRLPGKWKRLGRFMGRSNGWKKAVVTLRQGDTIELFEGV
ncbi:MAG: 50S ribosomal protein L23 [Myxococcales bacterium]|nr:MAG: 50S ribosomal protein L23 [Myxococcales bacterium]